MSLQLPTARVLNAPITALPFEGQMSLIVDWAAHKMGKFACVANVHMLMEAHRNPSFQSVLERADLVTPDGMPLVWMMRFQGFKAQDRVAGMEIFLSLCSLASEKSIRIGLLGATPEILHAMRDRLGVEFPELNVASVEPLPFRSLTEEEDAALVARINSKGVGIVFVALGCPKQECWMAEHKERINAVMIGIGGVFPVYAGLQKWAPKWCREAGLEWLYRLVQEPRRLWKRYATTIPPFIWLAARQLLAQPKPLTKLRS